MLASVDIAAPPLTSYTPLELHLIDLDADSSLILSPRYFGNQRRVKGFFARRMRLDPLAVELGTVICLIQ